MTSFTMPTVALYLHLLSMSYGFRLLVRLTSSLGVRADGVCQTVCGMGDQMWSLKSWAAPAWMESGKLGGTEAECGEGNDMSSLGW